MNDTSLLYRDACMNYVKLQFSFNCFSLDNTGIFDFAASSTLNPDCWWCTNNDAQTLWYARTFWYAHTWLVHLELVPRYIAIIGDTWTLCTVFLAVWSVHTSKLFRLALAFFLNGGKLLWWKPLRLIVVALPLTNLASATVSHSHYRSLVVVYRVRWNPIWS